MRRALVRLYRRLSYALRFVGQPIRIPPTCYVSRRAVIACRGGGSIILGEHCEIHDFAMLLTYGGHIVMGDRCSVNPFTVVYGHGGTRIGTGVRIAAHCVIIPANHLPGTDDRPVYASGLTARGIEIGDHVWLGAGCRILDGVRIGRHAIVGAGSVVTSQVAERTTVAGVPARVLETPRPPA